LHETGKEGKDEALTVVVEERQFWTPNAGSNFEVTSATTVAPSRRQQKEVEKSGALLLRESNAQVVLCWMVAPVRF
jgi:hypothetical protein